MICYTRLTLFHLWMITLHPEKKQLYQFTMEIRELQEALKTGDRKLVLDKAAEVTLFLPYLRLVYSFSSALKIDFSTMRLDFNSSTGALLNLITLNSENRKNPELLETLKIMTEIFCRSLGSILSEYEIEYDELEKVREKKIRIALRKSLREFKILIGENGFLKSAAAVLTAVPLTICYLCGVVSLFFLILILLIKSFEYTDSSQLSGLIFDPIRFIFFMAGGLFFVWLLILPFDYMWKRISLNLNNNRKKINGRRVRINRSSPQSGRGV